MKRTTIAIVYILLCITLSFLFVENIGNGIYNINKFTDCETAWFIILSGILSIGGVFVHTINNTMKKNILYLCKWVICVIFLTCICIFSMSYLTDLEFEIMCGAYVIICNIYGQWTINKMFEVSDET